MEKIRMTTPLVEMDGDEMTRILWKMIKDELLLPFIDLKTEYYDLGLEYRDKTNDPVTIDSAEKVRRRGQVRYHYGQCGPRQGVQFKGNVEEPQRNDPGDPGRNGVPLSDHRKGDRAQCKELEEAHHAGQTCLRRCL